LSHTDWISLIRATGLFEAFERKHTALYLWFKRGDAWERWQKFILRSRKERETAFTQGCIR
jgi:hypothetical protein